jgi:prepilin-type N-terminal cleavage/methylation domain-containing protein
MNTANNGLTRQKGYSIMEVLIAIVIFAIGMMALAQLQGSLTRSSANANVRTVATNIAEETIENLRGFAQLDTDPAGVLPAYEDIATTSAGTETRGGINYSVTTTVSDFYYHIASDTFWDSASYFAQSDTPTDAFSDFKMVSVNVAWDDTRPWLIDETSSFATGTSITLATVISSMATGGSSKVVTQEEPNLYVPFVDYSPGENPDIISLSLGDNKFKESMKPEPTVYKQDEITETRFDVITYSQVDGSALFVRREEFIAVSCECTLQAAPGDSEAAGRRPTIWEGDEYGEALFIDKPYGVSSLGVNSQSAFCDVCCQDHHDGGSDSDDLETAATKYDPFPNASREYWSSGTFDGDHKHYYPDSNGILTAVDSVGGTYLESCSLVRKDGFMRVIQDFNQEDLNVFAQDFLDETTEVGVYSGYLTGAITTYLSGLSTGYESSPPALTPPAVGQADTDLWSDYTTLPLTIGGSETEPGVEFTTQQLRERGIYIAYMSNDLRSVISCLAGGTPAAECESNDVKLDQTGSSNILEAVPFFEVQLTKLARWNETPINNPVDTTNEAIVTGNLYSRGEAFPGGRQGLSLVAAKSHQGSTGLTGASEVEPGLQENSESITVESLTGDPAIDPSLVVVSGDITSSVGGNLDVSIVEVEAIDASCDRTLDGFTCIITGAAPTIKIFGYGRATSSGIIDRVACSTGLPKLNESFSDINPWAIFDLSSASPSVLYSINIAKATSCGSGGFGG